MSPPAKVVKRIAGRMVASVLLMGLGLSACKRGPQSPEGAYRQLAQAAATGDRETTFDALDQQTRWSWMTVQRCQREAYDIVLSNFPDGPDKDSHLQRFEQGALAESAAMLFAAHIDAAAIKMLADRLPPTPALNVQGDTATAPDREGKSLTFLRLDGRWGYAGFQTAAKEAEMRAIADLETIKRSATDYERAARRGQP